MAQPPGKGTKVVGACTHKQQAKKSKFHKNRKSSRNRSSWLQIRFWPAPPVPFFEIKLMVTKFTRLKKIFFYKNRKSFRMIFKHFGHNFRWFFDHFWWFFDHFWWFFSIYCSTRARFLITVFLKQKNGCTMRAHCIARVEYSES